MRIQLVHPPVFLNVRSLTALRPSPPLGLAYIAAALRQAGHEVSVLDALAEGVDEIHPDGALHRVGLSEDQIVERIDPTADVVAIGNMWSFSWPLVREVTRRIHRHHPDKVLIGGGEHFSGLPEFSMESSPLDYIVIGEGEESVVELLEALQAGRDPVDVPGLALRRGGRVIRTPARNRKRELDDIPVPAWDLFDLDLYNRHALLPGLHHGMTVPVLATRGCPYRCTYCSSPSMWTTRWYARDPVRVVDEIEAHTLDHGATNFPFQDLTAILKRDWIVAFCQELKARDLNITWQLPSGTRCEVIDDEVARLMRETGGRHLAFAPESGSDQARERIGKQMKRDVLLSSVKSAVRQRLSLSCFLVLGFPDDDRNDLRASVRMAWRLAFMGVTDIAVGYFFPIPNTELYQQLMRSGRIRLDDRFLKTPMFANDPFLSERNNYSSYLSAARLSWTKHWIVASFYGISFATRPWRLLRLAFNVARGVETTKLETFLIELRRKAWIWVRRREPVALPRPRPLPTLTPAPARARRRTSREPVVR